MQRSADLMQLADMLQDCRHCCHYDRSQDVPLSCGGLPDAKHSKNGGEFFPSIPANKALVFILYGMQCKSLGHQTMCDCFTGSPARDGTAHEVAQGATDGDFTSNYLFPMSV